MDLRVMHIDIQIDAKVRIKRNKLLKFTLTKGFDAKLIDWYSSQCRNCCLFEKCH